MENLINDMIVELFSKKVNIEFVKTERTMHEFFGKFKIKKASACFENNTLVLKNKNDDAFLELLDFV